MKESPGSGYCEATTEEQGWFLPCEHLGLLTLPVLVSQNLGTTHFGPGYI